MDYETDILIHYNYIKYMAQALFLYIIFIYLLTLPSSYMYIAYIQWLAGKPIQSVQFNSIQFIYHFIQLIYIDYCNKI
jgi:hypothetical protein